ncbi:MAG: hypothetical protein F4X56_08780 [Gammaproteobacteria bacterium]|nr:hypothetical protein [Gammaproteobacteria bacterium]MYC25994.1 hypothetical protein [Gammaproteobacteria bacterium]
MRRPLLNVLLLCSLGIVVGIGLVLIVQFSKSSSDSSGTLVSDPSSQHSIDRIDGLDESLDLLLTQNSIELKATVFSYIAKIPDKDLGSVLELLANGSLKYSERVRYELHRALVKKLVSSNPLEALRYAVDHDRQLRIGTESLSASPINAHEFAMPPLAPNPSSLITSLFHFWAMSDVNVANSYARDLDAQSRKLALVGILKSQAGKSLDELRKIAIDLGSERHAIDAYLASLNKEHIEDPSTVWKEVSPLAITGSLPHEWVIKNVVLQWFDKEGVNIVDEIQASNIADTIKSAASKLVLLRAVTDTPELAFRKALKIPFDEFFDTTPVIQSVLTTWAAFDPRAAYNVLDEVTDPILLRRLQEAVVRTWAQTDPRYILESLANIPHHLHDTASSIARNAIATTNPEEAIELALKVPDNHARSSAIRQVLSIWMQLDLDTTINWVENFGSPNQQRYEVVDALTSLLVRDDPRRAFEIARNETLLDRDDTGLEADVVRTIAEWESVETAVELLAQVREGQTRIVASVELAERLINKGDAALALTIGLELPESEQAEYFPSITATWANIDSRSFVESIEKIPNAKLRSQVVLRLFNEQQADLFTYAPIDLLTEGQVEVVMQFLTDDDRATLDQR